MSKKPRRWSDAEIRADAVAATEAFRRGRLAEPREEWLREVDDRIEEFRRLFMDHGVERLNELPPDDVPNIITAHLLAAFRYLTGPPISKDDLQNLAAVKSLAPAKLREDTAAARRVLDVVRNNVDLHRFPWLAQNRAATPEETRYAILASGLLHAAQRVQSGRRNLAKDFQEESVRKELARLGLTPAKVKPIPSGGYAAFPARGTYSTNEVMLGPARADFIARLWDDQIIAGECKVSNSAVNSNKRLNKDTVAKVTSWTKSFGDMVIPTAIIAGVFSPSNVIQAQAGGLYIFWSHRLSDLGEFVESTRHEAR